MLLSAQQIAFFDVFGYLVLPKVFNQDQVKAMSRDFDSVALADRDGKEFDAKQRQNIRLGDTDSFKDLKYRDELFYPLQQLLGEGFVTTGEPGGGLFVGDTQWHPDVAEVSDQRRIKAGIYLDPVRKENGALRVVPGSHKNPLHELMQPMRMGRLKEALVDGRLLSNIAPASEADRIELEAWEKRSGVNLDDNDTIFGYEPSEIPCASLDSDPGDVGLFNQCIFHAAFGGRDGRRMVAPTWASAPMKDDDFTGEVVSDLRKANNLE